MPDNSYVEGTDLYAATAESNPFASAPNAIQVKVLSPQKPRFSTGWDWVFNATATTATMSPTAGNASPTPEYFRWRISDGQGNEAVGTLDTGSPSADVVIDTSGLNGNLPWTFLFEARKTTGELAHYAVSTENAALSTLTGSVTITA